MSKNVNQAIIPYSFESHEIRITKDDQGEPWWVAKDVCSAVGLTNPTEALRKLDDDEKDTLRNSEGMEITKDNRAQSLSIINEPGLYTLIIRSNKPEAKKFRKWVTSEVLPQIRKTYIQAFNKILLDNIYTIVPCRGREQIEHATLGVKRLFLFVQSKISALWGRDPKGPETTMFGLFAPLRRVLFLEVQHV